jgi:hypothetical protein
MAATTNKTAPELRALVDSALAYLDEMDGSEAWGIVDRIFAAAYHVLKQNSHHASLSHDQFDEQTAAVRDRLGQELDELIGGLVSIDDVYRALEQAAAAE